MAKLEKSVLIHCACVLFSFLFLCVMAYNAFVCPQYTVKSHRTICRSHDKRPKKFLYPILECESSTKFFVVLSVRIECVRRFGRR